MILRTESLREKVPPPGHPIATALIGLLFSACSGEGNGVNDQTVDTDPATRPSAAADNSRMRFAGFWWPEQQTGMLKTLEGDTPPLLPDSLALYQQRLTTDYEEIPEWDNERHCLPLGLTRLMASSPFELVVSDDLLAILFEWNRHVQLVPVGDEHSDLAYPYYLGHSIARYEDDVWTIDSTYFNGTTVLDANGLPHSDTLEITQKLRLEGPDRLVSTLTIEDPLVFSRAWQTELAYGRMAEGERLAEDVCIERLGLDELDTSN